MHLRNLYFDLFLTEVFTLVECFLIFRENFIGTRPNGLLKSQCQSPTTMCRVAAGNGDAKCLYQPFQERSSLHTLNSPSFLFYPWSSLQRQPAVQEGPHFAQAYLHLSDDRFPPAAQVCVCIYVLNICPNTKAL